MNEITKGIIIGVIITILYLLMIGGIVSTTVEMKDNEVLDNICIEIYGNKTHYDTSAKSSELLCIKEDRCIKEDSINGRSIECRGCER